jgi:hypothetical protein
MKQAIAVIVLALVSTVAMAQAEVLVTNQPFGTGVPGDPASTTQAQHVFDGLYHVPQYLPGNPTAAQINIRVVDVKCIKTKEAKLLCDGYNLIPAVGRGEYVLIRPRVVESITPTVIYKESKKKKE